MIHISSQEAVLDLEFDEPGKVFKAVSPDLTDSDRVKFEVFEENGLNIKVKADSLGSLRGGLNTAMRLVKISKKFLGD